MFLTDPLFPFLSNRWARELVFAVCSVKCMCPRETGSFVPSFAIPEVWERARKS